MTANKSVNGPAGQPTWSNLSLYVMMLMLGWSYKDRRLRRHDPTGWRSRENESKSEETNKTFQNPNGVFEVLLESQKNSDALLA